MHRQAAGVSRLLARTVSAAGIPRCATGSAASSSSSSESGAQIPVLDWDSSDPGLEERVLAGNQPLVIRHALPRVDQAAHSWSKLRRRFGDRTVEVEAASGGGDYRDLYRDEPVSGRAFQADVPLPLHVLLNHIEQREAGPPEGPDADVTLYLAQKDVRAALPELAIDPSQLPLKVAGRRLFQQSLWLGPRGTRTPLHCDPYFNLFCQVRGSKRFRVYPPEAREQLRPFPRGVLRNTSQADSCALAAPCREAVLAATEALFLPPRWWHEVLALRGSLSLSFWWT